MSETTPERWLPVPGYEGFYEVSDLGRVRSLPHRDRRGIFHHGIVRKPQRAGKGYMALGLSAHGVITARYVHHLVTLAFLGECPPGQEILHGDDNRANNRLDNLRYDTHRANQAEAVARDRTAHGVRNARTKVTPEIVAQIRAARAAGERGVDLAAKWGLSTAQVSRIGRGHNWAREDGAVPAAQVVCGERSKSARLTESDVRAIRAAHAAGTGPSELGRRYGVTPSTVSQIVLGHSWRHLL